MRYNCEFPFSGYYTKYFYSKEGRYRIIINKGPNAIYMNFARYLMCVHLGRILDESEQVHHKDENRTNDVIDNLEILSDVDHGKIHHGEKEFVDLTCCNCMKRFTRQKKNHTSAMKREARVFCSHSCNAIFRNSTKSKIEISFKRSGVLL